MLQLAVEAKRALEQERSQNDQLRQEANAALSQQGDQLRQEAKAALNQQSTQLRQEASQVRGAGGSSGLLTSRLL